MGKIVDMTWTFLSNHGNVIVYIDEHRTARLREIAEAVGITERATHKVVSELVEEGYLTRTRVGRHNEYTVNCHQRLRHPSLSGYTLHQLLLGMTRPVPTPIKHAG
jgi:predicted transcriptional regulator of viral defense system